MNDTPLLPLAENLWHAQHAFSVNGVPASTRMTVVRCASGELWVHSPIPVGAALAAQLQALGPVAHVVAPNCFHHLFAREFIARFPGARLYGAPGLARKRPDVAWQDLPKAPGPWAPDLQYHLFGGIPVVNETVWFHAPSGTLILTDLCQWWQGEHLPLRARLWARLTRVRHALNLPAHVRPMIRNRAAAAASARHLLALPLQRVIVAHNAVIEQDARAHLERALAPLF